MAQTLTGSPETVSVVMPAYRAGATIGRALRSVAAQTMKPTEVIVIDDASGDDTIESVEMHRPAMGSITLILLRQARQSGAAAARNRGLRVASGTYVAFLDADDAWLPEKLATSLSRLTSRSLTLVAHDGWSIGPRGRHRISCHRTFREASDPYVELYRKGYIGMSSVVARRHSILQAGGFDESLLNAHDFELWLSLLKSPEAKFEVFEEPLFEWYALPESVTTHVERRLHCGVTIARRYAPEMRGRKGGRIANLLYRLAAIHYEAMMAFARQGHILKSLLMAVRLPISIVLSSGSILRVSPPSRRPLNETP